MTGGIRASVPETIDRFPSWGDGVPVPKLWYEAVRNTTCRCSPMIRGSVKSGYDQVRAHQIREVLWRATFSFGRPDIRAFSLSSNGDICED